jgi:gliding motility-associated-like protein
MKKSFKISFICFAFFLSCLLNQAFTQTFSLVNIPQHSAAFAVAANCNVTISSAGGGTQQWQGTSIGTNGLGGTPGSTAQNCANQTGFRLEMTGAGNSSGTAAWNNSITVTFTFPQGVKGPVTFNLFDFTEPFYNDGTYNYAYYQDKATVTSTKCDGANITPTLSSNNGPVLSSTVGASLILTAIQLQGQCLNEPISIGTTADLIKTVTVVYSNQDPPTNIPAPVGSPPRYGISQYQYIFIGNITANPLDPIIVTANPNPICSGQTTTLTATSATAYTYTWASNTTPSTGSPVTATPLTTTTYTVTGAIGTCAQTNTITVTVNSGIVPTFTALGPYCVGATPGNLPTTSINGITGTWNPSTISTASVGTTVYTFTPTAGQCANPTTMSVIVTANAQPTVSANPTQICVGQSSTLTTTGGGTYSWSNSATSASIIVSPTTTTTYSVTVTNGGCSGSNTVVVTVNPIPTANAGADQTICTGQSTTLNGTGGGTYAWSNGINTATNTVSPALTTTYTLTVTNGGCTASDNVIVNINPLPTANAGADQTVCTGQSATLTATGGGTYAWNTGATTATINVTPASTTTYTVTVTSNGCTASDNVIVNVNASIIANAGPDQNICTGQSATLTATGGTTYLWSNGATTATTIVTPASSTTYTVTVSSGGCSGTDNVVVNIANNAVIILTPANPAICLGASIVLSATGANTYTWSPATGLSGTTGSSVTANPTLTTTYTVNGDNGSGCTGSATITVSVDTISATASSTGESCNLANGSVSVVATGQCTNGFTYLWDTPLQQTQQTVTNLSAGTYNVTVSCGACTAVASANIVNTPGPAVTTGSVVDESCGSMNGSATATATGGTGPYQYSWNSAPAQNTAVLTNVAAGTYIVTATDMNGCTATATAIIGAIAGPQVTTSSTSEMCGQGNGSVSVSASGGSGNYTYTWSTNPTQTSQTASNLSAGTYIVTVNDGNCSTTASVTLNNIEGPVAGIHADPLIVSSLNGSVTFTSTSSGNIISWQWNYGDGTSGTGAISTHVFGQTGTYEVTLMVTDNNGCTDIATIIIVVNDIYTVYIPNAFSPNNDGLNDLFYPVCTGVDPNEFEFMVFNRWGNIVFKSTTLGDKWNGTEFNNGDPYEDCVMDVYVYRIIVKPLTDGKKKFIGKVTLVN